MRIAEIAGITKDNIVLDADIPYFNFVHQPNRMLKTESSIRTDTYPASTASLYSRTKDVHIKTTEGCILQPETKEENKSPQVVCFTYVETFV